MPNDSNLESAQRIQEKFVFTLVALSFGILGLAVQTGSPRISAMAVSAELIGRTLLLVSAIAGLYRLEGLPYLIHGMVATAQDRAALAETNKMLKDGVTVALDRESRETKNVSTHKAAVEAKLAGLEAATQRLAREAALSYKIQRIGFVLGLLALTVGRSWSDVQWLVALFVAPAP